MGGKDFLSLPNPRFRVLPPAPKRIGEKRADGVGRKRKEKEWRKTKRAMGEFELGVGFGWVHQAPAQKPFLSWTCRGCCAHHWRANCYKPSGANVHLFLARFFGTCFALDCVS